MKKFKFSLIAVIALILGIAGSAFTAQKEMNENKHPLTSYWFKFMGDPTSLTDLQDNMKYSYTNGQPCTGKDIICAVLYSGTGSTGQHPDSFSYSFENRIASVYDGGSDAAVSKENE